MAKKTHSLSKQETQFVKTVWGFYGLHGRRELPWRKTTDPYSIVVSELMLQQTQVARVVSKYKEFLKVFPTVRRLAAAPAGEVLTAWQGLGYNRRAKFLHAAAQVVACGGEKSWPQTFEGLRSLPGIGAYTAGAVMNFAYNIPVPLIETNIRTAYIHHFFTDGEKIADSELLPIIARTLDSTNPREWNWALMDYGAYLKTTIGNLNTKSNTYRKQSNFKESNRFVRGAIVRVLTQGERTRTQLQKQLADIEIDRIEHALCVLQAEGLVDKRLQRYRLP